MRSRSYWWCVLLISSSLLVHALADRAAGQASRRGYSSRGVNPAGGRTSGVRTPSITGSRSSFNSQFGAAARGPLSMPNAGGFYLDLSTPYFYPGDMGQPALGTEGELGASSEMATPGSRPSIRPRLDIADRNALNSNTVLAGLNQSVMQQIAALAEKPFSDAWYAAHPDVSPVKLTLGKPWQRPQWPETTRLANVVGDPQRYDYRPDDIGLIYVHQNESRQERAVDARQGAIELADSEIAPADSPEILSLGVFAAVPPVDEPVKSLLHIVVSSAGTVSGYRYDIADDTMKPLRGAVNPATQRVAWRVGEDYGEAGLKNLTEDVARFLLFKSDGWTQPWILIRMNES